MQILAKNPPPNPLRKGGGNKRFANPQGEGNQKNCHAKSLYFTHKAKAVLCDMSMRHCFAYAYATLGAKILCGESIFIDFSSLARI